MLTGKGSRQKKKKCVKATAYPCGFTCIARRLPNGKEQICHNVLRNQAKTATLWLKLVEEKLGKINDRRARLGHSTLYANERTRLTPAKSSINPSGLSDRQLANAFLKEKENRKSSVLLAALGKEIDRRNAKQSANRRLQEFPPEQQKLLNLMNANLAKATKEEAKYIQQDIDDIKTLYPGIEPQAIAPSPKSNFRRRNARPNLSIKQRPKVDMGGFDFCEINNQPMSQ